MRRDERNPFRFYAELPAPEIGDFGSFEREPDLPAPARADTAASAESGAPAASSPWYTRPYPGGPMVKVKGFPRKLDWQKSTKPGVDVTAYQRTIARAGRWKWGEFSDDYTDEFARGVPIAEDEILWSGVAGVQGQSDGDVSVSGIIGEKTFNYLRSIRIPDGLAHAGQAAMDSVAVNLINEAFQAFGPGPPPGDVKGAIADYCRRSIASEPGIHYQQRRPMASLGIPPEHGFIADCSEHSTAAYYWARLETGVAVPDPNHSGYNGYGYTGTLVSNPKVSSPYQVGDLAIYGGSSGSTEHVCTCYVTGDANSSVWCSHGSEAAPYPVKLHYRGDLYAVVRPGLTP